MDMTKLQQWLGKTQEQTDVVGLASARQMAALLNRQGQALQRGDCIPAHWYAMLFAPIAPQSSLEADGHLRKGDFLPPVPLPRRMFAGRRVRFHRALRIGDAVARTSRIAAIQPKTGRSGEMCFVTVIHEITGLSGMLLTEEQDIVYRGVAAEGAPISVKPVEPAPAAQFSATFTPDPTHLFRYSAITFNAHRIHYDSAYAIGTEGYPGLVVNGGLTTLMLWDFFVGHTGRTMLASRSRNLKALFVNRPVTLCARIEPMADQALIWALDQAGEMAVRIELELEPK